MWWGMTLILIEASFQNYEKKMFFLCGTSRLTLKLSGDTDDGWIIQKISKGIS